MLVWFTVDRDRVGHPANILGFFAGIKKLKFSLPSLRFKFTNPRTNLCEQIFQTPSYSSVQGVSGQLQFFFGLRAVLNFSQRPQYIKNAP